MRTAATTVLFFSIGASVTNPMWLGSGGPGGVPAVISGVAGLMKDAAAGDMTAAAEGKR
jgi:hypothetical protein